VLLHLGQPELRDLEYALPRVSLRRADAETAANSVNAAGDRDLSVQQVEVVPLQPEDLAAPKLVVRGKDHGEPKVWRHRTGERRYLRHGRCGSLW
jgi:hypothetical protein